MFFFCLFCLLGRAAERYIQKGEKGYVPRDSCRLLSVASIQCLTNTTQKITLLLAHHELLLFLSSVLHSFITNVKFVHACLVGCFFLGTLIARICSTLSHMSISFLAPMLSYNDLTRNCTILC